MKGREVAPNWLEALGFLPAMGRGLQASDYEPGAEPVILLSTRLSRQLFSSVESAMNRLIQLDGRSHRIVGVLPTAYVFVEEPDTVDFIVALPQAVMQDGSAHQFMGVLRRAPGVEAEALDARLGAISARLAEVRPDIGGAQVGGGRFARTSFQEMHLGAAGSALWLVFAAVSLVLVITLANVAGLFLTRLARRRAELSLESALGAGFGALLRKPLVEAALLSTAGGMLGLLVSWISVRLLVASVGFLPRIGEVEIDLRALVFMAGLCFLSTLAFAVGAWFSLRATMPADVLREGGADGTAHAGAARWRGALVALQAALATVLLTSAVLLAGTLSALRGVELGFEAKGVSVLEFRRMPNRFRDASERARLVEALLQASEGLPGGVAAALSYALPMRRALNIPVSIAGRPDATEGSVEWRAVSPDYFRVLAISLKQGRVFQSSDAQAAQPVAIVNRAYADRHFGGAQVLGSHLGIGYLSDEPLWPNWEREEPPREIVGVVADVRDVRPHDEPRPTVYVPISQVPSLLVERFLAMPVLLVKAEPGEALRSALAAPIERLDGELVAEPLRELEGELGGVLREQVAHSRLLTAYAGFALLLNAVGLYGLLSDQVRSRRRELGVRMALGADARRTLLDVLRPAVIWLLVGLAAGLVAVQLVSGLLQHMLFGIESSDAGARMLALGVLLVTAAAALLVPAAQAARLQPMLALRRD
jgi:putative ABC transport system permease protein